jgi:hypothetical protein
MSEKEKIKELKKKWEVGEDIETQVCTSYGPDDEGRCISATGFYVYKNGKQIHHEWITSQTH